MKERTKEGTEKRRDRRQEGTKEGTEKRRDRRQEGRNRKKKGQKEGRKEGREGGEEQKGKCPHLYVAWQAHHAAYVPCEFWQGGKGRTKEGSQGGREGRKGNEGKRRESGVDVLRVTC